MSNQTFHIEANQHYTGQLSSQFSVAEGDKARTFHQRLDGYQPTPLHSLTQLAQEFGLKNILVKDESYRFGLNAFKMLGGVYAIARLLCQEYQLDISQFDFAELNKKISHKMTFATATDGNHGRGVAWAAKQLGQNAVVYMPKGAADERVNNIRALGAECIVTDMNYDDTVRFVVETARERGWKVVQDTAWQGYTEIPTWIMQGYSTLAAEVVEQIQAEQLQKPTHVILQAGVGAMAGGVLGYLAQAFADDGLNAVIIEPTNADCIYRSGCSASGEAVNVDGDLETIMVGLACGEPNPLGWQVLRDCATHFVSSPDTLAALGMRVLANPLSGDPRVISGESGAIGAGLLAGVHFSAERESLKTALGLDKDSVVLVISSEGDTDPAHYRDVVWHGKYPSN
ncbi:diaminopropionate ammonia-lyase [Vibrio sp. WXL103]|uniref:diaminopropionate ammonia-lyase n=1 Tax=Vibrio sp. WXL103 TaxID=3450710 RepID=UPI003EC5F1F9